MALSSIRQMTSFKILTRDIIMYPTPHKQGLNSVMLTTEQHCLPSIIAKVTVEPLGMDNSLLWTVSNIPTKFSYIFFKKTSMIQTLSNTDKTDTKSQPQWVNSYKLNLFITDTAVIR